MFQERFLRTVSRSIGGSGRTCDGSLEIGRFREWHPATCRERSEFLHLEISNFNTRSNLIALAEYRGSQLKPDHHSPADAAGRFRTTRWSVVLLSAQIAAEGLLDP
jgi:hypothetical protein